jgi:tight adherence protein C
MGASLVAGAAVAWATLVVLRPRPRLPKRVRRLARDRVRERRSSRTVAGLGWWRARPVSAWIERRNARGRADAVRQSLPDVADLLRLAASAGLTAHLAVGVVADASDGPLGEALDEARRRAAMGARLADGLDALLPLGDAVRPLHLALTAAARDGASLVGPLERVGDEARLIRRRRAEERARRLPVQLLFPLVLCILPAFGLLTVVPLLAGSLGSLPF